MAGKDTSPSELYASEMQYCYNNVIILKIMYNNAVFLMTAAIVGFLVVLHAVVYLQGH